MLLGAILYCNHFDRNKISTVIDYGQWSDRGLYFLSRYIHLDQGKFRPTGMGLGLKLTAD